MMNLLPILAEDRTFLLPKQASEFAYKVDPAWNIILWTTGFFFVLVVGLLLTFMIKYRRRTPNDVTSSVTHNTPLEIVWTAIPLVIVVIFFYVGYLGFLDYDTPPSNAMVIDVVARKWSFTFNYPNGGTSGELFVPKDKPVVLRLTSDDVLHGLYIPAFRTQRNLIPYRTTQMWFIATEYSPRPTKEDPGGYSIFCTQYCGDGHSHMFSRVHVLDGPSFEQKMIEVANPFKKKNPAGKDEYVPYVQLGGQFYKQYCATCHTVDGSRSTGPTWRSLYKSDVKFAASNEPGYTLTATDSDEKWDKYFTESVLHPEAKIVEGFGNQMTPFESTFSGSAAKSEKLRAIIEYIKSIGNTGYKPAINPTDNADLFDADKHPFHPESLAAKQAATQSQSAPGGGQ